MAPGDTVAPEVVAAIQAVLVVSAWALPYITSYFDAPQSLQQLQDNANDPQDGCEVHHIVEQTPARQDGFSDAEINAPDNLARIPTAKHWELNSWYETPDPECGGLTPRQYVRGKSWDERFQVGLKGLRKIGVLQ